ncbi:MAG: DUF6804 family protein [Candidatus Nealsonbacteria bacterium]
MVYKHKYFQLDSESKRIFDENDKELRLTGNAFRVLIFLCQKKNANITDIGIFLDWAKDYDENNMRQYRYKVNSIIGHDVVEYKNGVYYLVGEVKEIEKLEVGERNTDLLQSDKVELEKSIMDKVKNVKFTVIPAIVAIVFLLLSFFDWPYGYYNVLRIIVTGVAIYYVYYLYTVIKKLDFWFWGLVITVIIFNPIFPIYLGDKAVWGIIDVITAVFLMSLIVKLKKHKIK